MASPVPGAWVGAVALPRRRPGMASPVPDNRKIKPERRTQAETRAREPVTFAAQPGAPEERPSAAIRASQSAVTLAVSEGSTTGKPSGGEPVFSGPVFCENRQKTVFVFKKRSKKNERTCRRAKSRTVDAQTGRPHYVEETPRPTHIGGTIYRVISDEAEPKMESVVTSAD